MIYLDYAATTPVHEQIAHKMAQYLTHVSHFGNAGSLHALGKRAHQAIEAARVQVADVLHADPSEIIWTSGATEANNLAIKGIAALYKNKGKHIVTMQTEHKAVLDPCMYLEKQGFAVTYLPPQSNGILSLDVLRSALREDTVLVSMMAVNNETGIIQDLRAIRELTAERDIIMHVDAAQAIGKIQLNVNTIPIDAISLSAHKVYGPKGIGALYLRKRPRIRVLPLIHGGGHEQGMRSGTLPTHQIVGMGEAFYLAQLNALKNREFIVYLRDLFLREMSGIPNVKLNTDLAYAVPHILNVQFSGLIADAILAALPELAASTASACQEKGGSASHVLRAMGLSKEAIKASIRFSFGHHLNAQDIKQAVEMIKIALGIEKK